MLEEPGTGGARHWQVTSCVQGAPLLPSDGRAPGSHGHSWPPPGQVSLKASQTSLVSDLNLAALLPTFVIVPHHLFPSREPAAGFATKGPENEAAAGDVLKTGPSQSLSPVQVLQTRLFYKIWLANFAIGLSQVVFCRKIAVGYKLKFIIPCLLGKYFK